MDSGSWWWTGRPGMLQFMGSQTVGHDWGTELSWTLRNSHFQRCEVVSHCGFYLYVLFGHLYIFFGKMFNQDHCQFLNLRCFFGCWVIEVPYIFGYIFWINLFFYQILGLQIFSPNSSICFSLHWLFPLLGRSFCFWTVVLEKTLESPLGCKKTQPVHPKGDQSWVFTGRTDVEAETPILWPPDGKSWL